MDWDQLKKAAYDRLNDQYSDEYIKRLNFEIKEIEKQGANRYWLDLFKKEIKFESNKNGLVLPFLLGITNIDPIVNDIKHKIEYHPDFPDIDIDFMPEARNPVKQYAAEKYGIDKVCAVGMWIRYKTKLALQDVATALGYPRSEVMAVCKDLPEEFDTMPFEKACEEFPTFKAYAEQNPEIVRLAYGLSGKIKAQSIHAGGVVISNLPVSEHIPMTYTGKVGHKQWTSAWTEGMADTQLSKFGLIKFDILGLINLAYIWNAKKFIKDNYGIHIDFDDIDPENDRAGWIVDQNGVKKPILLNDPKVLKEADELKLDSIFQFDTNFQQSVVSKGGVKSFMDLVIYTSLGRPGPLPMIDIYIANRDDPQQSWRNNLHPKILNILEKTRGIYCFQEDLLALWTQICGFTLPEAEAAQKAVKKKKTEIFGEIGSRVIDGAKDLIGEDAAKKMWDDMVSFGGYCFNMSHAVAYVIISYRCLWLKTYYPAEWWASVLSNCPQEKFSRYISSVRSEKVPLGGLKINDLTSQFSVKDGKITLGLSSIKGIGTEVANNLVNEARKAKFTSYHNFIERCGNNKIQNERLIKLGAFDEFGYTRKVLWTWYSYQFLSSKSEMALVNYCYAWPMSEIKKERERQFHEYQKLYPKRKKIPTKIENWVPTTPYYELTHKYSELSEPIDYDLKLCSKMELTLDHINEALESSEFTLSEILSFEKQYLDYYWSSPLDMFVHRDNTSINDAKSTGRLECVIENKIVKNSKNGNFYVLEVTDGVNTAKVNVWNNEITFNDPEVFEVGVGISMNVNWQEKFNSFSLKPRTLIMPLESKLAKRSISKLGKEDDWSKLETLEDLESLYQSISSGEIDDMDHVLKVINDLEKQEN